MSTNPMIQFSKDQLFHWRQDIERKHEEQEKHMKELEGQAERLQCETDQLQA